MATKSSKKISDGTVKLKAVTPTVQVPEAKAASTPKIVARAAAVKTTRLVKKPEFLDLAIARTAVKKRDAKPAIEAALAELADLLKDETEVNLPPLGKIKIMKSKDVGDGAKVLTLKLRTMKDDAGSNEMPGVDPAPE